MAFGYCMWAINDFVFVFLLPTWVENIMHYSPQAWVWCGVVWSLIEWRWLWLKNQVHSLWWMVCSKQCSVLCGVSEMKSQFTHGCRTGWPFHSVLPHGGCQANIQLSGHAQDNVATKHGRTKAPNPVAISVHLIQRIRFHNVFVKFHTLPEKPGFHSGGFIGNESTERSLDILFFSPTARRFLFWT